jgi:hypothetical protein
LLAALTSAVSFSTLSAFAKFMIVQRHVVALESLSEFLALLQSLLNGVTDECDDALALGFVHAVLKGELRYFDCVEELRLTV